MVMDLKSTIIMRERARGKTRERERERNVKRKEERIDRHSLGEDRDHFLARLTLSFDIGVLVEHLFHQLLSIKAPQ